MVRVFAGFRVSETSNCVLSLHSDHPLVLTPTLTLSLEIKYEGTRNIEIKQHCCSAENFKHVVFSDRLRIISHDQPVYVQSSYVYAVLSCALRLKSQTPLHGHRLRTPPTDELTTIVQQICHIAVPEPNISPCQDVGMWQIFVRWWCL